MAEETPPPDLSNAPIPSGVVTENIETLEANVPAATPANPRGTEPGWAKGLPDDIAKNVSKFGSVEELAKAYDSQQREFSRMQQAGQPATTAPGTPAPTAEKLAVTETPVLQPDANGDFIARAGLAEDALVEQFEQHGNITAEQRAALHKVGATDADIQTGIEGRQAKAQLAQLQQDKILGEAATTMGSQESLNELLGWAKDNIPEAEKSVLNDQLGGLGWKTALLGLQSRMNMAGGVAAEQTSLPAPGVQAANVPSGDAPAQPYASLDALSQDMMSKEYRDNPAFKAMVEARATVTPMESLR